METATKDANRPGAFDGEGLAAASGVMAGDILPNDPTERRRRDRLYALRAMDRLGLLGEDLIPTLAGRPDLRWLANEEGARWGVLIELGRIREPRAFEAAVRWVLETRPCTEQAKTEIHRFRLGSVGLPDVAGKAPRRLPPN